MINEKLKPILSALVEKTKKKEAIWNQTSGENQFMLKLSEGISLVVGYYEGDQFNSEQHTISLFNSGGDIIQRYYTDNETPPDDRELLQNLYQAASDAYYRVDETFAALLKSVTSEGIIGKVVDQPPVVGNDEDDDLPF